jgi:hypothetical protein
LLASKGVRVGSLKGQPSGGFFRLVDLDEDASLSPKFWNFFRQSLQIPLIAISVSAFNDCFDSFKFYAQAGHKI